MDLAFTLVGGAYGNMLVSYISDGRIATEANESFSDVFDTRRIYVQASEFNIIVEIYNAYEQAFIRYIVDECQNVTPAKTVMPKEYLHLMTSTTPFWRFDQRLTIYARSQLWKFRRGKLHSVEPIIPPDMAMHFDFQRKPIVDICDGKIIVYERNENVVLRDVGYEHYLCKFPPHTQIIAARSLQAFSVILYNTQTKKMRFYCGDKDGAEVEAEHAVYQAHHNAYALVGDCMKNVTNYYSASSKLKMRIAEYETD